jgi:hypothetical protein
MLPSGSCLAHLSTDNLLSWAYPSVDCRPCFVDNDAPGRGCARDPPASWMAATYYVGFVALCGRIDLLLHRRFRRSIGRDRSATSPLVSSLLAAGSICYFTSSEQRPLRAAACLSFDGKTAAPVRWSQKLRVGSNRHEHC